MKSIGDEKFCDEWERGYRDCENGVKHDDAEGEIYKRGYGTRYEEEQLMTAGVMRK